jgi:hypothetical protein
MPQRIGLFGEIVFLDEEVLQRLDALEAIRSWRGPHQEEQDFLIGGSAIEVKTQLSTADRAVRISSAAQLDPGNFRLFLCHQTLGVGDQRDTEALSLNGQVEEIASKLGKANPAAEDLFRSTLFEYGYVINNAYDEPRWSLNGRQVFEVEGNFPRLVPAALPTGITEVSYELQLDACGDYRVEEKRFQHWVFGDNE